MTKQLSEKVCRNRLTKWIESKYTEEEQNYIGYYDDVIKEDTYSFKYRAPGKAFTELVTINRHTGSIVHSVI